MATRKPMCLLREEGISIERVALPRSWTKLLQDPPRTTRFAPVEGPSGSIRGGLHPA